MAMTPGYLLNVAEKNTISSNINSPAQILVHSKEKYAYNDKAKKIAMLLIASNKVKQVKYAIDERTLFEELGRISYENVDHKISDMKKFGSQSLLEQAIIANISNWEAYFSKIFGRILNDDKFISRLLKEKDRLRRFLREFRLSNDFQNEVLLNKNKFDGLKFGTYILENRKINFQDIESIKKLLNIFFDIKIVQIYRNWNEIDKLFSARHILVHGLSDSIEGLKKFENEYNRGKRTISEIYDKQKIEKLMKQMETIIYKVDIELFNEFDTKYLN